MGLWGWKIIPIPTPYPYPWGSTYPRQPWYLLNARPVLLFAWYKQIYSVIQDVTNYCPKVVRIKMCRHHIRPVEITHYPNTRSSTSQRNHPASTSICVWMAAVWMCWIIKLDGKTDSIVITCAKWWFDGNWWQEERLIGENEIDDVITAGGLVNCLYSSINQCITV